MNMQINHSVGSWAPAGQLNASGSTYSEEAQHLLERITSLQSRLDQLKKTDPQYASLAQLLQTAELALLNMSFTQGGALPKGYRAITDPAALARLGLAPGDLYDPVSGYEAAVFFNQRTGQYVYVNRGSNDAADWFSNGAQALGAGSPQYIKAIANARAIAQATGGNVVFTGTSLGGGLATAQAYETGMHALVFNPSGVSVNTLSTEGLNRYFNSPDLVTVNIISGDWLNLGQDFLNDWFPASQGNRVTWQQPKGSGFWGLFNFPENHRLGKMALSISNQIDEVLG